MEIKLVQKQSYNIKLVVKTLKIRNDRQKNLQFHLTWVGGSITQSTVVNNFPSTLSLLELNLENS